MVNRELIEVFSEIARENNVERSELGSILEDLFLHLVERERGDASNCSVIVNLDKGEFEIYVEKSIVDLVEDPVMEITLVEIAKVDQEMANDLELGDTYVEIIDPLIFGRRLIHMAKQFFSQKLQDVEKKYIYEDWKERKRVGRTKASRHAGSCKKKHAAAARTSTQHEITHVGGLRPH